MLKQPIPESGVPRRVLGQCLRDLRQQAGFTVKAAARAMEWSEPKLWRIETGQTALRTLDVQAMCTAYGAAPGLTRALAVLAGQTRAQGWWRAYGEAISDDLGIYQILEDAASGLSVYAPSQIPGLLRTEAYTRALITSAGLSGGEADRLVFDCLARRALLTRASMPLQLAVAVDEALVRRTVGGPEVMAGQLRLLADMAALPTVCLRVVPYRAGQHPGLVTGAFTMLHFLPASQAADDCAAIVYAAGLTGELYLDKPYELQRYRDAHDLIFGCALGEHDTQALLLTVAKELEQ